MEKAKLSLKRIEEVLFSSPCILVDRRALRKFGCAKAIFLATVQSLYQEQYEQNPEGVEEKGAPITYEQLKVETRLSERLLKKAKDFFVGMGVLKITRRGLPSKEYYQIDFDKLEKCLREDSPKSPSKSEGA